MSSTVIPGLRYHDAAKAVEWLCEAFGFEAGLMVEESGVIVADVEAHAERARAAGTEILNGPSEQDYGGSNHTCRDFEGNIWNFGSYNPWT